MLPTYRGQRRSAMPQYVRRIVNYRQMDFEYTFWQMFTACINPSKLYRSTTWHKQTKNQWARDDPAFVVILLALLIVSSVASSLALGPLSVGATLELLLWHVLVDFLLAAVVTATLAWLFANRFLRVRGGIHTHSLEQSVEWLYAFDVHCNAFFPLFLLLHVVQFLLWPLLLSDRFAATLVANSLYFIAHANYWHVTFLGYNALPFLQHTVVFVYPTAVLVVLYFVSLGAGWNVSRLSADFSLWRIGQ